MKNKATKLFTIKAMYGEKKHISVRHVYSFGISSDDSGRVHLDLYFYAAPIKDEITDTSIIGTMSLADMTKFNAKEENK